MAFPVASRIRSTGWQWAAGGVISPTDTVAVDEEEHPLAETAEMVNTVVLSASGCALVKVPVIGEDVPEFEIPVKIVVFVRSQLKVVLGTLFGLEITMSVIAEPEQTVWSAGEMVNVITGFTVIVNVMGVPVHSNPLFEK